jgi:isochorismate synthase
MSFKSIAICKLPHSSEFQIFTGSVLKCPVLEFELTDFPQFVLTNGLNPEEVFWISGDVKAAPMNLSTPDVLVKYIQSIGDFRQVSSENSLPIKGENSRRSDSGISQDFIQDQQNDINGFNRQSKENKDETRLNGNNLEQLINENINNQPIGNWQNKVTTLQQFTEEIEAIKTAISNLELEKVVAARIVQKELQGQNFGFDSLVDWYFKLCGNYPDCLVYLFLDSELGVWIGASPELLFDRDESGVSHTVSLAGTLFGDSEVWSEKEILEQSTTSQHINEILHEFNLVAEVSPLQERKNGALRHLVSQYSFTTQTDQIMGLIHRLNPTPAVIGYPQNAALDWVKSKLKLERELYSGAVGILSTRKSLLHVNLRCAKVYMNQKVDLFAGCGINLMSDPVREWQETQLKSEIIGRFIPNPMNPKD